MIRRTYILFVLVLACAVAALEGHGQPTDPKAYLLQTSRGQTPTDTEPEDSTKLSTEDQPELGGKALKILLINSFGDRVSRVTNWKPFTTLVFNAINPTKADVKLSLNVKHKKTTTFATRVEMPFVLKPGVNVVRMDVADMTNSNGSAADLKNVVRWYVALAGKTPVTLYFGDFWFEGSEAPTPAPGGGAGGNIGYRVKGKVGTLDVDLTLTPFVVPSALAPTAGPATVRGDPARVARIRAARMPKIDKPIEFFTPEADAICSALEVFPPDNPWNLIVEDWPLHPNSKGIVASIGEKKPFRYNPDMGFVLIPPDQKKVDVKIVSYPAESDPGPFPVPGIVPIEGWPLHFAAISKTKQATLEDVQRDKLKQGGDRHGIVVDPTNRMLYEFYQLRKTEAGWVAAQASIFDLKTNKMRPDGWTSTDAAGLPIFPATVRHDELKRGLVDHAMRVTVVRTRRAYVYPATHFASPLTDENLPRMGERLRLRKDFDISEFSPDVQAILKGLKKYGMYVADNGIDWAISVAPDPRIGNLAEELRKIKGSDFEVVTAPAGYEPPN